MFHSKVIYIVLPIYLRRVKLAAIDLRLFLNFRESFAIITSEIVNVLMLWVFHFLLLVKAAKVPKINTQEIWYLKVKKKPKWKSEKQSDRQGGCKYFKIMYTRLVELRSRQLREGGRGVEHLSIYCLFTLSMGLFTKVIGD